MASPAISARLKYLNNSAHRFAITAPGTSAYLMSRCNSIMFDHALEQTEAQQRRICGACGNIMILGLTGTRQLETLKSRKRRSNSLKVQKPTSQPAKVTVYTCELCSRQTRQHINSNYRGTPKTIIHGSHFQEAIQNSPSTLSSSANTESPDNKSTTTSANATSKRRAKVRKQGGLQALLAKNRDIDGRGNSGGFGLDILDLMKKA